MVKIEKEGRSDLSVGSMDEPSYPYGTQINLHDELIDELGVGGLTVGDVVKVSGYATVQSRSEHESKGGETKHICLQFTEMDVSRKENDGDRVKTLYGES